MNSVSEIAARIAQVKAETERLHAKTAVIWAVATLGWLLSLVVLATLPALVIAGWRWLM